MSHNQNVLLLLVTFRPSYFKSVRLFELTEPRPRRLFRPARSTDCLFLSIIVAYPICYETDVGVWAAEGDASSDVDIPYLDYKRD